MIGYYQHQGEQLNLDMILVEEKIDKQDSEQDFELFTCTWFFILVCVCVINLTQIDNLYLLNITLRQMEPRSKDTTPEPMVH